MKPLPGLLETYVRARLAWWEKVSVVGGDLAAAERHAMQKAHQAWQEAGFPGYTTEADTAAVFALVARECGAPEQPETLLEAVKRLAAFKYGEGRHDARQEASVFGVALKDLAAKQADLTPEEKAAVFGGLDGLYWVKDGDHG